MIPTLKLDDTTAIATGALVNLFERGLPVYFKDRPVTRMTATIFKELQGVNKGGTEREQLAAFASLVAFMLKDAMDASEDVRYGVEPGRAYYVRTHPWAMRNWDWPGWDKATLDERIAMYAVYDQETVWLVQNDTTEYPGVPGSDGGWTLMFGSDSGDESATQEGVNPREFGHSGRCDTSSKQPFACMERAVAAVLSAFTPDGWSLGAPAASIAFLCAEHVDAEPIAQREHAEHNAQSAINAGADTAIAETWKTLLAAYPNPVPVVR